MLEQITSRRCRVKSLHGVVTQKHDRFRSDWDICYFGFMGEVGVAMALGIEPNWSVLVGGDDGTDILLKNHKLQVKTPLSRSTRDWLYFNDERQVKADVLVLCNIDEYETGVLIRGAISKQDFLDASVTKNFGYGERLAVHESKLRSMDELITNTQKHKKIRNGHQC